MVPKSVPATTHTYVLKQNATHAHARTRTHTFFLKKKLLNISSENCFQVTEQSK